LSFLKVSSGLNLTLLRFRLCRRPGPVKFNDVTSVDAALDSQHGGVL